MLRAEGWIDTVIAEISSQQETRAAAGALVGGLLWAIKGVSILVADYQPALTFELAPFFMGLAAIGLAANIDASHRKARLMLQALALLALMTAGLSAVLFFSTGDSDAFGFMLALCMLSLLAVLGYGGWLVRGWSVIPLAILVITLVALPVGGALSDVEERLLEVPLLVVSAAWISLGLRFWKDVSRSPVAAAPA